MTLEEMKQHEWIVSWSGGKDSTATIIKMHENNVPIKEIIYVRMMFDDNTPATLPIMTEFIDQSIETFKKWGYKVTVIKSIKTAMDLATKKYKKSKYIERIGKPYGMTAFCRGHCCFQIIKQKTIEEKIHIENDYQMIGYACDEIERLHRLNEKKQSILASLGIKETKTFDICLKYKMLNPIYYLGLTRDGCFFCPNASNKCRKRIRRDYPGLVKMIDNLIEMADYDMSNISSRNLWVRDYYTNKKALWSDY